MIRFECDYNNGYAEEILYRLAETNREQTCGYGEDEYCGAARAKIKAACGNKDVDVHFMVGATQVNLTVIAAALRPHQGVISAPTGHINVHESGSVEATGHKVLVVDSADSKVSACTAREYCKGHYEDATHEHMVQPGMIYISMPTESGMMYTKKELQELRSVCNEYDMLLFVDGARMGYALASEHNDVELSDLCEFADAFYIGGTKVGAMFGEALVISNKALQKDFRYLIKQRGGLLAKGRLLGLQFDTLFTDGVYMRLAKNAVDQAMRIKQALLNKGIALDMDSYTNQQFPIFTNAQLEKLSKEFVFSFWGRLDEERAVVRICTSWATGKAEVDRLIAAINGL